MHTISFVDSYWWMDEPSFISLGMEFDDILRWNKFFEEISSMYSYISSTPYNLLIVSFPPLNFIHVQWLNIDEISFFYGRNGMKTQVEVKTFQNIVHKFFKVNVFITFQLNWNYFSWIKLIIIELNLKTRIPNNHSIILVTKMMKVEFYSKGLYQFLLSKLVTKFSLMKNIFIETSFTIKLDWGHFKDDFFRIQLTTCSTIFL